MIRRLGCVSTLPDNPRAQDHYVAPHDKTDERTQRMKIRFLDIAQYELDEAIRYYNLERPSLGDEFLAEVLRAREKITYDFRIPSSGHL